VIDNGNKEGNNESEIQSTNPKFPRSERESVSMLSSLSLSFSFAMLFLLPLSLSLSLF